MAAIAPAVRRAVLSRDRGCVAALLFAHVCRDAGGSIHPATHLLRLELDHVRDDPMAGQTAPSDPSHLVALCRWAHQTSGWATSNRDVLQRYLDLADRNDLSWRSIRALRPFVKPAPYPMAHGI